MENQIKEIEFLERNIDRINKEKNEEIKKSSTIKVLSICCLALLGFITFNILFLILGGFVLGYKQNIKKPVLQWISGFLCILPIILPVIGTVLLRYEVEVGSDDLYYYYELPYYYYGIIILSLGELLFYVGSICSLIFIINEINKIENTYKKKIGDIEEEIKMISKNNWHE